MEAGPHRHYRNTTPSTVPVATMTPRTRSASKSVRISLMVSTPFKSKIAPVGRFVNLGATLEAKGTSWVV
jgi:hypothetical protein